MTAYFFFKDNQNPSDGHAVSILQMPTQETREDRSRQMPRPTWKPEQVTKGLHNQSASDEHAVSTPPMPTQKTREDHGWITPRPTWKSKPVTKEPDSVVSFNPAGNTLKYLLSFFGKKTILLLAHTPRSTMIPTLSEDIPDVLNDNVPGSKTSRGETGKKNR